MKKLTCIAFAGALLSAGAFATPSMAADPGYWGQSTPAFNWSGFYAGAHGGYGTGRYSYIFPSNANVGSTLSGGFGGVQAGYNWHDGGVVWGVEADASLGSISGTSVCPTATFTCNASINFMSTLRGRVGLPMDNVLAYVTAGAALGNIKRSSTNTGNGNTLNQSQTALGWAAGAGVEVALDQGWSIGGEYLYVDFPRQTFAGATVGTSTFSQVRIGAHAHTFRVKANFRW